MQVNCRNDLTAEYVRRLIRYEPETGELVWLTRTPDMFKDGNHSAEHVCRRWNSRLASSAIKMKNQYGYICARIDGVRYLAHRIAWLYMTGEWPMKQIDHRNGICSDNRWENLRAASALENGQNLKIKKSNKSGFPGVHFSKHRRKWIASIKVNYVNKHLGNFDDQGAAFAAYLKAKSTLHSFNPEPRMGA